MGRIFAVAVLLALALTASSCTLLGDNTIIIKADFAGVPGLYVGDSVDVLGVAVGKVESITPQGTNVLVTMSVPADLKIPASASAAIVPASLVTDRFLELTPAYHSGPVIGDGALIPSTRTHTPVEFDDVVRAVSALAGDLSKMEHHTGAISAFLGVSAADARDNGARLREVITGASTAMATFARNRSNTTQLVTSLARLAALLADNDQTVRAFGATVTQATAFMTSQGTQLNQTLNQTLGVILDVASFARHNRAAMSQGMANLDVTARTLGRRTAQLSEAMNDLPLLMQNVARAYDPQRQMLRARADFFRGFLNGTELVQICKQATKLPACALGSSSAFGPDLGLTELLLDTLSRAIR